MVRLLAMVMLGSVAIAQSSFADVQSEQKPATPSVSMPKNASGILSSLPPAPRGKSTVIGGAIRDVDPVRDQITLNVFGGHPMKIFFDARTKFYRDGKPTPLRDLGPDRHASIETVLDGTNIYALSIHVLSQLPEGECEGQVVNYNPATRELTVNPVLSGEPIVLRVPAAASIVRPAQAASSSESSNSSDLVKGTLVSVKFQSSNNGRGVASRIAILATPGATFVFSGNVTFLDLHSQVLALVDPRDGKSYKISFDPARFPISHDLHDGNHVTVTATFDGTRYVANDIKIK